MKLHTGDTVVVITGKDKGKTGTVLRVLSAESRVIVGGINMRIRHVKKTAQAPGRKIQFEASIHASNVMLIDPKTKKRSRIGYAVDAKGKKKRIAVLSGEEVVRVKAEKMQKKQKNQMSQKKDTEGTSGDLQKKSSESSASSDSSSSSKKSPFWKKMGFGAAAMQETETGDEPRSKQDHSIPDQQVHVRSGPRGS